MVGKRLVSDKSLLDGNDSVESIHEAGTVHVETFVQGSSNACFDETSRQYVCEPLLTDIVSLSSSTAHAGSALLPIPQTITAK